MTLRASKAAKELVQNYRHALKIVEAVHDMSKSGLDAIEIELSGKKYLIQNLELKR